MALNAAESADLLLVSVARVSTFFLRCCKPADERFLRTNDHAWATITLLSWNQHCNESINLASKFCSLLRRMFTFFPSSNWYWFCSAFYSSGTVTLDKSKIIVTKSGLFEWKSEITRVLEIPWTDTKKTLSASSFTVLVSVIWKKISMKLGQGGLFNDLKLLIKVKGRSHLFHQNPISLNNVQFSVFS